MKINTQLIILGVFLFIIILISLCTVSGPVPYSKDTLFGIQYPYEGFEGDSATSASHSDGDTSSNDSLNDTINKLKKKVESGLAAEGMFDKKKEGMFDKKKEGMTDKKKEGMFDKKKVEGFSGLLSSPYGTESNIDVFSQLNSSKTCTSSPYSNSQGYLCLDANASKLLQTRGGNATGGNGQIV
jgi:hypothetical protein